MELEQSKNPEQEKATNMEITLFLSQHIDNPCEVEVYAGQKENIRGFYLKEAEKILLTMTDENARKMMEEKIAEYKE